MAPEDSDPVQAMHPRIRLLYEYWVGKRGARRAPSRSDIDPVEMRDFLPHIYMFDVVQPGARLRYRLVGTAVAELTGEVKGRFVEDVLPADMYGQMRAQYDDVIQRFIPRYHANDLAWQGRPHIRYSRLLLPLSDDQRSVNVVLGIHYHERPAGPAGREVPLARLKPMTEPLNLRILPDREPS